MARSRKRHKRSDGRCARTIHPDQVWLLSLCMACVASRSLLLSSSSSSSLSSLAPSPTSSPFRLRQLSRIGWCGSHLPTGGREVVTGWRAGADLVGSSRLRRPGCPGNGRVAARAAGDTGGPRPTRRCGACHVSPSRFASPHLRVRRRTVPRRRPRGRRSAPYPPITVRLCYRFVCDCVTQGRIAADSPPLLPIPPSHLCCCHG